MTPETSNAWSWTIARKGYRFVGDVRETAATEGALGAKVRCNRLAGSGSAVDRESCRS